MRFGLGSRLLNGRETRTYSHEPSPTTNDISAELKRRIQLLYVAHVTTDGVNYTAMQASPEFAAYVEETARLPQLNVIAAIPDDPHKIAFFVNLYNALTQHAVAVLGPPPRMSFARLFYGMSVAYQVGPFRLSLNDIENGILRANKGVSIMPKPFGRRDPRKMLCVDNVDPRIHFVLNCAASSCPPVLFLTADNIEYSLGIATKGFLLNDHNFRILEHTVYLSRIFDWYRKDFSEDGAEIAILNFVVANGPQDHEKFRRLRELLQDKDTRVSISWLPYDWSLNSSS